MNPRRWFDLYWHRLAWFDVHRAKFWQLLCASLLVAGATFAVCVIVLAPFT